MNTKNVSQRGRKWFNALTESGLPVGNLSASVLAKDAKIGKYNSRVISIVPDENNPFPRARLGEVGLLEGWYVAKTVREVVDNDKAKEVKTPIIAIVDVPSQAYGRREEAFAINLALAAAGGAYAYARLNHHPVVTLIVGKAMSGGFLAHGYQANRIIALNDNGVMVHAMNKAAAARITLRSIAELEKLAEENIPMAYDIKNFAQSGVLWRLIDVDNADDPTTKDINFATTTLEEAISDIYSVNRVDLVHRLTEEGIRKASIQVRNVLRKQW